MRVHVAQTVSCIGGLCIGEPCGKVCRIGFAGDLERRNRIRPEIYIYISRCLNSRNFRRRRIICTSPPSIFFLVRLGMSLFKMEMQVGASPLYFRCPRNWYCGRAMTETVRRGSVAPKQQSGTSKCSLYTLACRRNKSFVSCAMRHPHLWGVSYKTLHETIRDVLWDVHTYGAFAMGRALII